MRITTGIIQRSTLANRQVSMCRLLDARSVIGFVKADRSAVGEVVRTEQKKEGVRPRGRSGAPACTA